MKKLLLSICVVLTVFAAKADTPDSLTLTFSNLKTYTSFSGRDYLRNILLSGSSIPNFNVRSSSRLDWDLRGQLAYDTTTFPIVSRLYALVPSKYADSTPHRLGNIYFYGNNLVDLDVTYGLYAMSEALDSQNVYAPRMSGGTDTLIFDDVTNSYTNATWSGYAHYYEFPKFPVNYKSAWQSAYTHAVSFTLNDYQLGYAATPGKIYFSNMRTDSIVNYGTMRLVMPNNDTTKKIQILQDKVITTETDSFTINGAPFPSTLLAQLGVAQGMTTNTYSYKFYRAGRLTTPLIEVWYTDASFTTVSKVWVDTTYISTRVGVPEITNTNNNITVYPNPVTNHVVNIDIPGAASGVWSCELVNITGQQVASGNLSVNGDHAQVFIPASLAPGIYYLRINNNGLPIAVKPLTIK